MCDGSPYFGAMTGTNPFMGKSCHRPSSPVSAGLGRKAFYTYFGFIRPLPVSLQHSSTISARCLVPIVQRSFYS